jgi:hypothetical protein
VKPETLKTDEDKSPMNKRLVGLLLLYAVASVIVAKVIAELAFAGGPL